MIVQEISTHIVSGDYDRLGLSDEQAGRFRYFYLKAYVAQNGDRILSSLARYYETFKIDTTRLDKVSNKLKEIYNEAEKAKSGVKTNATDTAENRGKEKQSVISKTSTERKTNMSDQSNKTSFILRLSLIHI